MNTQGVTISKSEENKETVNYSLDYEVSQSKDNSSCKTQSKRLHQSENDSDVFAPANKIFKTDQILTITDRELLKQQNDNCTDDSRDNDCTDDSQKDDDTDDSQEDDDTNDSQEDDDTDGSQEDDGFEKDKVDLFYVTHETQVSEGGEADLHKHHVGCKKNPGHTKFVPVNDFNINHLPVCHHDNDLFEFIKATADLTVRLAVKKVSEERPEFYPDTTAPFSFYNMRGSDVLRVGTGMVKKVNMWTEEDIKKYNKGTCPCPKCQHSDTPSKVWGDVEMNTATHVVFDDDEARHTTCRLFYDGQESPFVTLDGWEVVYLGIESDCCLMKCATCDLDLLVKLHFMCAKWILLWNNVHDKYEDSGDEFKLTFIVSHPHGCPKQISVGQWEEMYTLDNWDDSCEGTKYTYTTCTCPGSSGAHVYVLGCIDWVFSRHLHSGVDSKGNNISCVGQNAGDKMGHKLYLLKKSSEYFFSEYTKEELIFLNL